MTYDDLSHHKSLCFILILLYILLCGNDSPAPWSWRYRGGAEHAALLSGGDDEGVDFGQKQTLFVYNTNIHTLCARFENRFDLQTQFTILIDFCLSFYLTTNKYDSYALEMGHSFEDKLQIADKITS